MFIGIGAGISSAYQGIEKSITGERMHAGEYATDVSFGAITGVITGGAGTIGESVAANVAKQGAKVGIRAATGVVAGVSAKALSEVKECTTTDKKFEHFGQMLDSQGNVNVAGTVASWTSSGVVGVISIGSSQLTSNLSVGVGSGVEKCLTRVGVSAVSTAAADVFVQTASTSVGSQDSCNTKLKITS